MHRELYCQIKYLFSFVKLSACVLLWSQVCLLFPVYSSLYVTETCPPFCHDRECYLVLFAFSWQLTKKCCLACFQEKKIQVFKISGHFFFFITKHATNTKLTPEGRSRSAGAKQEFQLIAHLDCLFYKCTSSIVIRSLQYLRQIWRCCVCIALRLLTPLNIVIRGGSWSVQISNRSCQMSKPTSRHVLCLAGNVLNQPIEKVCFWTVTDSPHSEIGQNYPCFYLRSGVLF